MKEKRGPNPQSPAARQWNGYGTALKPAWEPICLARKPIIGTVAANVLEHGTGALNIDGCRVEGPGATKWETPRGGIWQTDGNATARLVQNEHGRWPANLCHDGSEEVLGLFPDQMSGANPTRRGSPKFRTAYGEFVGQEDCVAARGIDSGSAARFFYCAKASKAERDDGCGGIEARHVGHYAQDKWSRENMGNKPDALRLPVRNHHPTVKPIALMEYLCKLASAEGATVLDPFMGSGTTGIACHNLGRTFVGIELDPEYFEIAQSRIEGAKTVPIQAELFA
jgi:hypothetical protein